MSNLVEFLVEAVVVISYDFARRAVRDIREYYPFLYRCLKVLAWLGVILILACISYLIFDALNDYRWGSTHLPTQTVRGPGSRGWM